MEKIRERLTALQMAAASFGAYQKYATMMSDEHLRDVLEFKVTSKRVARKLHKDIKELIKHYHTTLERLELSFDTPMPDEEFIACCKTYSVVLTDRLVELQQTFTPYAKEIGKFKNARLKSMIKGVK